jgi:hypothetical protein
LLALVVLALSLGQVLGPESILEKRCVEACEDDDAQGRCASDCSDCACCANQRIVVAPAPRAPMLESRRTDVFCVDRAHVPPDPGEILHIPKRVPV